MRFTYWVNENDDGRRPGRHVLHRMMVSKYRRDKSAPIINLRRSMDSRYTHRGDWRAKVRVRDYFNLLQECRK